MILYILIGIITFDFLFERLLEYLNLRNWKEKVPQGLEGYYDQEKYSLSQKYHKEQARLGLITESFNFILIIAMLLSGGFGWLSNYLETYLKNPVWLALAFFGVLAVITTLLNLPFGLYDTFVIEQKYGFNRTTPKTYFLDLIKGLLLTVIIGVPIGFIILTLIIHLQASFWIYAWILIAVFMVFVNFFYTSLFVPLFNKLTPLPEGELRSEIEAYAAKVNFPLTKIMVMNGSKRSSKANAFFSGFGSRKTIVLFDTLIEKQTTPELVSVLAHEVGHYKKKHIIQGLILSLLQMGLMLFLMSRLLFNPALSAALGADSLKYHLNLLAIGILFGPFSMLTGIAMNVFSRKNEFEADSFAVSTSDGEVFKEALLKMSVDSLSNLDPHPAYVFVHYSHPPVLERVKQLGISSKG